ncbi:hypothetical protein G6F62_015225 [Rhizopus arrhizus]|nr:hypothetical protein G6F35_017236 [Rhizopus arrhizus]KAG1307439.1 hypothetical protein G6F62_015225 [Rhizopus arrhizus]
MPAARAVVLPSTESGLPAEVLAAEGAAGAEGAAVTAGAAVATVGVAVAGGVAAEEAGVAPAACLRRLSTPCRLSRLSR